MTELLVIVAALALGSFVKGVTGSGLPQIAIPIMATFLGVERAVVIMAIPGVVSNGLLILSHRGHLRASRDLPVLVVSGILGTIAGTWLLRIAEPRVLSAVLAAMVLAYVGLVVGRVHVEFPPKVTRFTSPPVGLAAGALQGATGISGPLLVTYLHGFRLDRPAFVLMQAVLFQVYAVTQVAAITTVGLYSGARLAESLLALVPMLVLLPLGTRLARRMSAAAFDRWILLLLSGTALKLLYDALLA